MSLADATSALEAEKEDDLSTSVEPAQVNQEGLTTIEMELQKLKSNQNDIHKRLFTVFRAVIDTKGSNLLGSGDGSEEKPQGFGDLDDLRLVVEEILRIVEDCSALRSENSRLRSMLEVEEEHARVREMSKVLRAMRESEVIIERFKDQERELKDELETLRSRVAWQETTISESNEVIRILTETIKSLSSYITELEQDSLVIPSPALSAFKRCSAELGEIRSDHRRASKPSFQFHQWLDNVEKEVKKLSLLVRSTRGSDAGDAFSKISCSSNRINIPYSYSETEFSSVAEHDIRFSERLTAFNKTKCYEIRKSNVCVQLPACFNGEFGDRCSAPVKSGKTNRVVIGNKTIMAVLWRRRVPDGEDEIALVIRGWKNCTCTKGCDESETIGRCLVLVSLASSEFAVKKYYIVNGKTFNCEHRANSSDAPSGTVLVDDTNFCPASLLQSSRTNAEDGFIFSVTTLHLVYGQRPSGSKVEYLSPSEKFRTFQRSSHMNCTDVVFRFNSPKPEVVKACDCVLRRFSPLVDFIAGEDSRDHEGPIEFCLKDMSRETMSAFLNYIHGVDNGVAWREDVPSNLQMLEFSHQFFMPELAQLATDNLIVNPDDNYTLELVLKLQSLARKLQNYDLESRARQWFRGKSPAGGSALDDSMLSPSFLVM